MTCVPYNMKKIALVIPSLSVGGAEKICLELAEMLAKDNIVYIVTFGDKLEFSLHKSLCYIPLGIGRGVGLRFFNSLLILRQLRCTLQGINPYGTISFMERANIYCRIALFSSGLTFVPTIHATVQSFSDRGRFAQLCINFFYRFGFSKETKFITVSPKIRDDLSCVYGFTNVDVVPNGLSTEKYQFVSRKPGSRLRLLVVSRLHPEKQTVIAILATHLLMKKGIPVTLTIIGDGVERFILESLVRDLELVELVTFLGAVVNPFHSYLDADCLLVTSRTESFGISIIEAILCGIPVLSLDCPTGPKDISTLLDGQGIRLVPFDSQDQGVIASAFSEIIVSDFYGSDRLSKETIAASKVIQDVFSIDRVAGGYLSAIDEIRARRKSNY